MKSGNENEWMRGDWRKKSGEARDKARVECERRDAKWRKEKGERSKAKKGAYLREAAMGRAVRGCLEGPCALQFGAHPRTWDDARFEIPHPTRE